MNRLWLLAHSVRHTRARQLLSRLWLLIKRRASAFYALLKVPATSDRSGSDLPVRASPPPAAMPPRTHLVATTEAGSDIRLLNRSYAFELPMNWHAPELEVGTRLEKLNLHYMEYLEGFDDDLFVATVLDWIKQNPPYGRGYWRDNWNSYALSIRVVVWMQQYQARVDRIPADAAIRMRRSLVAQLRFLRRNLELDIGGNHLVKNIKALLWGGRFFCGAEPDGWSRLGERLLRRELGEQVLADGMHYERSPAYHVQVFVDLLECCQVVEVGAVKNRLEAALDRMAQVTVDLVHPDGRISLFNDGGLSMTYPPEQALDLYRHLRQQTPEPRAVFALEDAGYYGVRDRNSFVLVDCGPIAPDFLPAHGHGDILAFEWTVAGKRFVVDAGVYEYHPGEMRDYSRSTASHNTVTVGGEDQCEFWGSFRVARRAHVTCERYERGAAGFSLQGSHNGYRRLSGRPVHRRSYEVRAERLVVADEVVGGSGQTVEARLLLHPECKVELEGAVAVLRRGDVAVALQTEFPMKLGAAWWAPDFGVRKTTRQLVIRYPAAPSRGGFTLERVPHGTGS